MTEEGNKDEGSKDMIPKADYDALNDKFTTINTQFGEIQKKLGKLDIDTLLTESREYKRLKKESIKDPKELEETITKEVEGRFSSRVTELETLSQTQSKELKQLRVTSVVQKEANEVMLPEGIKLIQPIVERYCDYEEGQIVIKDDNGKVRYSKKNPNEKMGVREFIDSLADEYPAIAKSTATGGSRESGESSKGSHDGLTQEKYLNMSEKERAALPKDVHQKMAALVFSKPKR